MAEKWQKLTPAVGDFYVTIELKQDQRRFYITHTHTHMSHCQSEHSNSK